METDFDVFVSSFEFSMGVLHDVTCNNLLRGSYYGKWQVIAWMELLSCLSTVI